MLGYPESERPGGGAVAGLPGIPDAGGWRGSWGCPESQMPRVARLRGCPGRQADELPGRDD